MQGAHRGELERKNDGKIQRRGCPEKGGAMGAQELNLRPYPSKIQRYKENVRKESKIREIFSRNYSSLLWQNRNILRRHVRPLRRAHTAASWAKNVVNIRFYYPDIFSVTNISYITIFV